MGFSFKAPVPKGYTHIQGVGDVKGKKMSDLQPGDRIMWNYGYTSTVVEVKPATRTLWELTEKDDISGNTYTRRKKPDTYVAFVRPDGTFEVLR